MNGSLSQAVEPVEAGTERHTKSAEFVQSCSGQCPVVGMAKKRPLLSISDLFVLQLRNRLRLPHANPRL